MRIVFILFVVLFSTIAFCQNSSSEVFETNDEKKETPLEVIENVPVYKGCGKFSNNPELKKCMSDKITELIVKKFNTKVVNGLGLPDGLVRINVIFKIDKTGDVVEAKASGPHPKLEEEALRVIKLIPRLDRAGYQRGKPVTVPYSLPIMFKIDNSKNKRK